MTIQNLRTQIRRKGDFVDVGKAGVMLTYLAAAFGAETNYTKGTNFKEKQARKKERPLSEEYHLSVTTHTQYSGKLYSC